MEPIATFPAANHTVASLKLFTVKVVLVHLLYKYMQGVSKRSLHQTFAGGGLHENFSEIDFLIASDRGDEYLTADFCPMKKYCS